MRKGIKRLLSVCLCLLLTCGVLSDVSVTHAEANILMHQNPPIQRKVVNNQEKSHNFNTPFFVPEPQNLCRSCQPRVATKF